MARSGVFHVEQSEMDEIDEAMARKVRVLDPAKVKKSVEGALDGLNKALDMLRTSDFVEEIECKCGRKVRGPLSPRDMAQVTAYTAKVVDQIYRLSEFASGRPDSRPEQASAESLLEVITDEQLQTLMRWVEEAKGRGMVKPPKGAVLQ